MNPSVSHLPILPTAADDAARTPDGGAADVHVPDQPTELQTSPIAQDVPGPAPREENRPSFLIALLRALSVWEG